MTYEDSDLKSGEIVVVTDDGCCFNTYHNWPGWSHVLGGKAYWISGHCPSNGDRCKVIYNDHGGERGDDAIRILVERLSDGQRFLIGPDGLERDRAVGYDYGYGPDSMVVMTPNFSVTNTTFSATEPIKVTKVTMRKMVRSAKKLVTYKPSGFTQGLQTYKNQLDQWRR